MCQGSVINLEREKGGMCGTKGMGEMLRVTHVLAMCVCVDGCVYMSVADSCVPTHPDQKLGQLLKIQNISF